MHGTFLSLDLTNISAPSLTPLQFKIGSVDAQKFFHLAVQHKRSKDNCLALGLPREAGS